MDVHGGQRTTVDGAILRTAGANGSIPVPPTSKNNGLHPKAEIPSGCLELNMELFSGR